MDVVIILIAVTLILFIASFITKRRFGLLGLALATGSILSGIWGYDAGLMADAVGLKSSPMLSAIILALITLLPAVVLLFHGYTYKSLIGRIVGASLFTILALAFLVEPMGHVIAFQGLGATIYGWLSSSRTTIIGVGLFLAIIDLFFTKPASLADKHHKH